MLYPYMNERPSILDSRIVPIKQLCIFKVSSFAFFQKYNAKTPERNGCASWEYQSCLPVIRRQTMRHNLGQTMTQDLLRLGLCIFAKQILQGVIYNTQLCVGEISDNFTYLSYFSFFNLLQSYSDFFGF